jgi:hypothetical protein
VRGDWIENKTAVVRLFYRFEGNPLHTYRGRVEFVGFAPWGTTANPARIFELLE